MDQPKNLDKSFLDQLKRYKAVIFDFDGTLVDLKIDWQSLKDELKSYINKKEGLDYEFTPLGPKIFEAKSEFGETVYNQVLQIINKYELQNQASYQVNKTLIEYINSAPEDQKIVIYSMNTFFGIDTFFKNNQIRKPDLIVCQDSASAPKPSAIDLNKIVDRLNIKKSDIIYIGNSPYHDGESGKAAGIKTEIIIF